MTRLKRMLSRDVRKYIYGVAIAAFPVLIYFGLMEPEVSPMMLVLLLALLNLEEKDVTKIPAGSGRHRKEVR